MGRRTFHYNKKAFKEWGPRASFLRLVLVPPFLGPPGLKQLFFKCNLHFFSFVKNWWTTIVWILWFWTKNVFATISFTFSIHLHCSVKNCGCGWIQIILWVMFVEGISSELKILKEQFGIISIFVGREHGKWKKLKRPKMRRPNGWIMIEIMYL